MQRSLVRTADFTDVLRQFSVWVVSGVSARVTLL